MMARREKVLLMIAAFRSEQAEAQLLIGEGFTMVEAIVRAIEYREDDERIFEAVRNYGPDDFDGLYDWYLGRGIYISEPLILGEREKFKA